jgi:hypothetical protein
MQKATIIGGKIAIVKPDTSPLSEETSLELLSQKL